MSGTTASTPNEILVSNATELYAALQAATEGTVIKLEGGDYGELVLNAWKQDVDFPAGTTITSADPDNPASFSKMFLYQASNLTIDNVVFDYEYAEGDGPNDSAFSIRESSNISITNSLFVGEVAQGVDPVYDGAGYGVGLSIHGSSDINLANNELKDFTKALVVYDTDRIDITDNEMHDLHADGILLAEVNDVLIEGNYIHDIKKPEASDAHQDMIQLFSGNRDEPSTNITITGNIMVQGDGDPTQGLHFRNEAVDMGQAGAEMYYENITISDNIIMPGLKNGILVGEVNTLTIENNTVLMPVSDNPDISESVEPQIYLNNSTSTDVTITGNIALNIPSNSNPDYKIEDNLIVQSDDPTQPNYFDNVFVNGFSGISNTGSTSDLAILPGSGLDSYGSSLQSYGSVDGNPTGIISADKGENLDSLTVDFNPRDVVGPNGALDLNGAKFTWDFGDGTTADGYSVSHTFADTGAYEVTTKITLASGEVVELKKTVDVVSPIVVDLDFNNANELTKGELSDIVSLGDKTSLEGGAVRLNGDTVTVDRNAQMLNNDEFSFVMDFKLDSEIEGTVRMASLIGAFQVKMQDGRVIAGFKVDGEDHWIYADAPTPTGVWHSLALTYSEATGEARVFMDGNMIGSIGGLSGHVSGGNGHNLIIGDKYSTNGIDGLVDNVAFLSGALSEEQIQNLDLSKIAGSTSSSDTGATPPDTGSTTPPPQDTDDTAGDGGADTPSDDEDEDDTPPDTGVDTPVDEDGDDDTDTDTDTGTGTGTGTGDTSEPAYAQVLKGTGSSDVLRGTSANEAFYGGSGNDIISTGGGDNAAYGEAGDDILAGSSGNDNLFGGTGNDILKGQDGDDFLDGGAGVDTLKGMDGDDMFVFDSDDVYYHGGDGYDTLLITAESSAISDISRAGLQYFSIEEIDADNGKADKLIVDHRKADRSDTGVLTITGDSNDQIVFEAHSVQITGQREVDGELYFEVETKLFSNIAEFLVDADMTILDQNEMHVANAGIMSDDSLF